MSSRDGSSLSDRERAILDSLATKVAADDPSLAATLRDGRRRPPITVRVPPLPAPLQHWAIGLGLALVGLALALATVSSSVGVALFGVALTFVGTARVIVAAPWIPGREPAEAPPTPTRN